MKTIKNLLRRFQTLDPGKICVEAIEQTTGAITKQNLDQLHHGLNAKGEPVGHYKNEEYAVMKFAMNPLPGFGIVDLELKSDYYAGMSTSVIGDSIVTESGDPKNSKLLAEYGPQINGLGGPFKAAYVDDELRPVFKSMMQPATGLKMV